MTSQIIGYYSSRKENVLKDFDRTSALLEASLVERYGKELTGTLQTEARQEYEKLIPEIPFIKGFRARALNSFLLITAQELAVYKAMKKNGKPPAEAWELCHRALRLRLAKMPRWKRQLLGRVMFSRLAKKIVAKRARRREKIQFGDFEVEYLIGEEDKYDYGVNYFQCGNYAFAKRHAGGEFAPYICMSDIALSEALGWGVIRTQTIADGCPHCDFRFKKGAPTHISSKTPEVQNTINRIRKREAEQGAAADG